MFLFLVVKTVIEVLELSVKFFPFCMPLVSLSFLPFKPLGVLCLDFSEFFFKFAHGPLMETKHVLDLKVESLYPFVLVHDCVFQITLLSHHLFHIDVAVLQLLIVLNVSQRHLGSMTLYLLFPLRYYILVLSLNTVVTHCYLC